MRFWLAVIVIGGVALFWGRGFVGLADGQSGGKARVASTEPVKPAATDEQSVDLSEKQAASLKIGPVASRDFALLKTAVGTIDFNEKIFSFRCSRNIQGRILKAFYNIGDEVKAGDVLFTIDSPRSASGGIDVACVGRCARTAKARARARSSLLKAGGSAQKDVDQATSDQQTAEGNFKAAKDAVRIFGKSDAEIEQILNDRKVNSRWWCRAPSRGGSWSAMRRRDF